MSYPYHIKQAQPQQQQAAMADAAGVYLPTGPGDAQSVCGSVKVDTSADLIRA